jgi:hypothetical protein
MVMTPKVIIAEYVENYTIHIVFSDGTEGDVNFDGDLEGEIFKPLKDLSLFRQFAVHPELHTVTWPNGADIAPEYLYRKVQISA